MKKLIAIALSVAIAAMGSVANAGRPDIYEFEFTVNELLWDCGDFEIWDDAVLRSRVKEFYDENRDFEKVMVHGWFTERFYNATTGKSVEGGTNGYNFSESADVPGAWIHHGLMYHVTVPGVGRVLVDAGYFIMQDPWEHDDWHDSITWQRGNHQNIDGDYDKLCAALR